VRRSVGRARTTTLDAAHAHHAHRRRLALLQVCTGGFVLVFATEWGDHVSATVKSVCVAVLVLVLIHGVVMETFAPHTPPPIPPELKDDPKEKPTFVRSASLPAPTKAMTMYGPPASFFQYNLFTPRSSREARERMEEWNASWQEIPATYEVDATAPPLPKKRSARRRLTALDRLRMTTTGCESGTATPVARSMSSSST
jgi:hypothetical protein